MKRKLVVKKVFVCSKDGEPLYSGEKTRWGFCFFVPSWLSLHRASLAERRERIRNEFEACKWICENTNSSELRTLALKRYCEIANSEGIARRGCL